MEGRRPPANEPALVSGSDGPLNVRSLEEIERQVDAERRSPEAKAYDPSRFFHPSVTVDLIIFTIIQNDLRVLLIKRSQWPFRGRWALPGGFVQENEDLGSAAARELHEETGVHHVFLEQLHTFGHPHRDPRTRVITVAYYALVPAEQLQLEPQVGEVEEVRWFSVYELPELAFDHDRMLNLALRQLRTKILDSNVAFQLMPQRFTLTDLQRVYEIVLGRELDKRNFRKKILASSVLIETDERHLQGRHRPARLFEFDMTARDF